GAAVGVTLEPESSRWRPQGNLKALRRADMHTGCTYGLRSFAYRERDVPTGVHTRELRGSIRTISLRETRRLDERPFSRCPGPCPPGRAARAPGRGSASPAAPAAAAGAAVRGRCSARP